MNRPYLFLDFDNTLSEMKVHNLQYIDELSTLIHADFGGELTSVRTEVGKALAWLMQNYYDTFSNNPVSGFEAWVETERVVATQMAFNNLEIEYSSRSGESLSDYIKRIQFDALTGTNALYPSVYPVLQTLFDNGYRMHLASSNESQFLLAALVGAGIESFTESKYGPDLVDCPKEGRLFYDRIFQSVGIDPKEAVVIDDQICCLEWAEQAGAVGVLASLNDGDSYSDWPFSFKNWSDLPDILLALNTRAD